MPQIPHDARFDFALLLNGVLLMATWRFAGCLGARSLQRAADALLIYLTGIYVIVWGLGIPTILTPLGMIAAGIGLIVLLFWGSSRLRREEPASISLAHNWENWTTILVIGFVLGFVAALVWEFRSFPVMAEDAMTYHLPAAVRWLQDRRIDLLPTWFFNPANTYSPLGGSCFAAWWMGLSGNDILARFMQVPALLLMMASLASLCRSLGASRLAAILVAAAAGLCAPLIAETTLAKDDLLLAAFFITAIAGCAKERLADRFGPWRFGLAIGMMLATKYTALLALPIFALLIDAPFRARWRTRQWMIAGGCALVLAGPWYLRNWIELGNPVYPIDVKLFGHAIFNGLFSTTRSPRLATFSGFWQAFTEPSRRFSLPIIELVVMIAGWLAAVSISGWKIVKLPLHRACWFGAVAGLALFVFLSPYSETRFVFPAMLLLFACWGIFAGEMRRWKWGEICAVALVGIVAILSLSTSFRPISSVGSFSIGGLIGVIVAGICLASQGWWQNLQSGKKILAGAIGVMIFLGAVYVYWPEYEMTYKLAWAGGQDSQSIWQKTGAYGSIAQAWAWIDQKTPHDAVIAYSGTHIIYPLIGYDLQRRVVYVPTRHGLKEGLGRKRGGFDQLPHFLQPASEETIVVTVDELLTSDTDAAQWLAEMRKSRAAYLLVAKHELSGQPKPTPPELGLANAHPEEFHVVMENDAAVVFAIGPLVREVFERH